MPPLTDAQFLDEIQHRAFLFFWEQSDSSTGLTHDRAWKSNEGYMEPIASIAATGYLLAELPIGVEHGWVMRENALARALVTLHSSATNYRTSTAFTFTL